MTSNLRISGIASGPDAHVAGLHYDIDWTALSPGYGFFWNFTIRVDVSYGDLDLMRAWQVTESDDRFMYEPLIGNQIVSADELPRERVEAELGELVRQRIEQTKARLAAAIAGEQGEAAERGYAQDAAAFTALRNALKNAVASSGRPTGGEEPDGASADATVLLAAEQDPDTGAAEADARFKNEVLEDLAFLVRGDCGGIDYSASVDDGVLTIQVIDRNGRYRTFELTAADLHHGEQG